MKIKIALVPKENIDEVQFLTLKLQEVMEAGKMILVDQITEKLLLLTDKDNSTDVSEKRWHQLVKNVRSHSKNFTSEYTISNTQMEMIIATKLNESFTDIVNIIKYALKNNRLVLQLPHEETVKDV